MRRDWSGRLDRHIRIGLPGPDDVARNLREHLGSELTGEDLKHIVLWATGMSGADCERVVREARQRARFANRPLVLADLEWVVSGRAQPEFPADALWLVAVHEAGHAVVALDRGLQGLDSVAIGRDGWASLGRTTGVTEQSFLTTKDVRARVTFMLAGRAAEEVLLGQCSSGAGGSETSDLARAMMLLMSSYTALGLREHMTPIWLGLADSSTSMAVLMASHPGIAKSVATEMAELYENAKDVVRRRRAAIAMVAQLRLERRVLSGNDVKAIVERFPPAKLPDLQEGDERCLLRPIERSD